VPEAERAVQAAATLPGRELAALHQRPRLPLVRLPRGEEPARIGDAPGRRRRERHARDVAAIDEIDRHVRLARVGAGEVVDRRDADERDVEPLLDRLARPIDRRHERRVVHRRRRADPQARRGDHVGVGQRPRAEDVDAGEHRPGRRVGGRRGRQHRHDQEGNEAHRYYNRSSRSVIPRAPQ
jgi:hypothetical protein